MWFMELLGLRLLPETAHSAAKNAKLYYPSKKEGKLLGGRWDRPWPPINVITLGISWSVAAVSFSEGPFLPNGPAYLKAGTESGQSGQKLLRLH